MDYLGDFLNGATVNLYFTTHNSAGGAVAPLSAYEAADVLIYKNSSNAQKTTTNGITMTSPFDTVVGLHNVTLDTSNNTGDTGFWAIGNDYTVVLSADTETVDGQVVVRVLGQFSLENRCVNWAKVGSPTTTVALSGTTIKTATDVETDTQDIQSRLPAALTAGGNMKSDMLALNGGAQSAADLKDFADDGYDPSTNKVQGVVLTDTVTTYTGNTPQTGDAFARLGAPAGASVSADVAAVKTDSAAIKAKTDNLPSDPADASVISGRFDTVDAALTAIDTETDKIASIKTKTDSLTFTVPGQVDANAESMNATPILGTGTAGDLWRG